jgi:hypothetical protein
LAIPNPHSSINILEPDNLWLYSIMPKQPNDGFIRSSTAVGQQKMSPAPAHKQKTYFMIILVVFFAHGLPFRCPLRYQAVIIFAFPAFVSVVLTSACLQQSVNSLQQPVSQPISCYAGPAHQARRFSVSCFIFFV